MSPMNEQQREDLARYNERTAEIARNARASRAIPASPRHDEWSGVHRPQEFRSGPEDSSALATGPEPQEYKAPVGGELVFGPGNVGRVVNNSVPATKPAEPEPKSVALQKAPSVAPPEPKAGDGRFRDVNACGPVSTTTWVTSASPVIWPKR